MEALTDKLSLPLAMVLRRLSAEEGFKVERPRAVKNAEGKLVIYGTVPEADFDGHEALRSVIEHLHRDTDIPADLLRTLIEFRPATPLPAVESIADQIADALRDFPNARILGTRVGHREGTIQVYWDKQEGHDPDEIWKRVQQHVAEKLGCGPDEFRLALAIHPAHPAEVEGKLTSVFD